MIWMQSFLRYVLPNVICPVQIMLYLICRVLMVLILIMKEASRKNLVSGSTATIVLLADGQILVANIGDSKALLCSEKFQSHAEAKGQKGFLNAAVYCFNALLF